MKIDSSKKFDEGFFTKVADSRKINFLVLHHIAANSADEAIQMLKDHGVSAHFLIDEAGAIFQLVDENDIAFHAGVSYWGGVDGLNKVAIGVEFINSSPFEKKFTLEQMTAGVELTKYLAAKYRISAKNIVGHSDIAYDKDSQMLDRKQDPSHLFDWKFLAENGVGIRHNIEKNDAVIFRFGDKDAKISLIKESLKRFGYRVLDCNDEFNEEMKYLARVFNRRFNQQDADFWYANSDKLLSIIK